MKKIILSLFLFLTIFSVTNSNVFAQGACPGACKPSCAATEQQVVGGCPQGNVCCNPSTNSNVSDDPMAGCGANSINTAIGCIPVSDTNAFMGWVLGWAVGVGGGVAFLLIVYSSFMIMTSQGDPARLKAGQELLTSAISGLIMLIFSVFILKFIGVDILDLDSFGFNT